MSIRRAGGGEPVGHPHPAARQLAARGEIATRRTDTCYQKWVANPLLGTRTPPLDTWLRERAPPAALTRVFYQKWR
eukprot:2721918-Pyramimonas_sp.AAC.1